MLDFDDFIYSNSSCNFVHNITVLLLIKFHLLQLNFNERLTFVYQFA